MKSKVHVVYYYSQAEHHAKRPVWLGGFILRLLTLTLAIDSQNSCKHFGSHATAIVSAYDKCTHGNPVYTVLLLI